MSKSFLQQGRYAKPALAVRSARRARVGETARLGMVAEIDAVAAGLAKCYRDLPPTARATALQLSHSLSSLRTALLA